MKEALAFCRKERIVAIESRQDLPLRVKRIAAEDVILGFARFGTVFDRHGGAAFGALGRRHGRSHPDFLLLFVGQWCPLVREKLVALELALIVFSQVAIFPVGNSSVDCQDMTAFESSRSRADLDAWTAVLALGAGNEVVDWQIVCSNVGHDVALGKVVSTRLHAFGIDCRERLFALIDALLRLLLGFGFDGRRFDRRRGREARSRQRHFLCPFFFLLNALSLSFSLFLSMCVFLPLYPPHRTRVALSAESISLSGT